MFILMPIQNSLKTVNLNIFRIFNEFKTYYVPILLKKNKLFSTCYIKFCCIVYVFVYTSIVLFSLSIDSIIHQ